MRDTYCWLLLHSIPRVSGQMSRVFRKQSNRVAIFVWQLRERDWCNVITAHEGDSAAYTWRLSHLSLGEHVLRPRRAREKGADAAPDAPVTAVAISCCGNFGLVGTAAGRVDRYNMQSGLHRGSYCRHVIPELHDSGL